MRIIPPQDQRKRILNKSSCWGENAIVRATACVLYECVRRRAPCDLSCWNNLRSLLCLFLVYVRSNNSADFFFLSFNRALCDSAVVQLVCTQVMAASPDCLPLCLSVSHPFALSVTDFDGLSYPLNWSQAPRGNT